MIIYKKYHYKKSLKLNYFYLRVYFSLIVLILYYRIHLDFKFYMKGIRVICHYRFIRTLFCMLWNNASSLKTVKNESQSSIMLKLWIYEVNITFTHTYFCFLILSEDNFCMFDLNIIWDITILEETFINV